MNAPAFARAGSPFSTTQIRTDRDNEYDAFARVTRRLPDGARIAFQTPLPGARRR